MTLCLMVLGQQEASMLNTKLDIMFCWLLHIWNAFQQNYKTNEIIVRDLSIELMDGSDNIAQDIN